MHGIRLLIVGLALAFGNFLVVLDTTIANVSLSNIAGGLAISPQQGTWVITSYAVADAIVVPLTGWLALRYGPVKVMAGAMMLFGFWSAMCGLSHSLTTLVIARVLQGACGAPMIPMTQSLLLRVFGPKRTGAATGVWASTTIVAPVLGPFLGGRICDNLGWEWIFYVNVPIAFICAIIIYRMLGARDDKPVRVPVDYIGLLLLIIWVGATQIMLDKGRELDWFSSPFILGLLVVAITGFIAFVIWELTSDNPVVDLRIFANPTFVVAVTVIGIAYGSFFASNILLPLWMQTNLGYTASESGNVSATMGMTAFVMAPIVARLSTKIDLRLLLTFGMLISFEAMVWRTHFASNMTAWDITFPTAFQGIGMPFFFLPATALAMSSFSGKQIAAAAGLSSFVRTLVGAFAASIATTQWDTFATNAKVTLASTLNGGDDAMRALVARGFTSEQARAQIDGIATNQSIMMATTQIFSYLAGFFILAGLIVWLVPRPKRPAGPVVAH